MKWKRAGGRYTAFPTLLIDVAKRRNEVLVAFPGVPRRKRLSVLNTRDEHDRFIAFLTVLGAPVVAAFEATGNCHRPIARRLIDAGIDVRLISSTALARTREALHNGWDSRRGPWPQWGRVSPEDDPKDAQAMLHMMQIGATQVYQDPIGAGINDIQELSKTHEMVSKAKTELWHRVLTHDLPLYCPEAERFNGGARTDAFLALLEADPTPASITAMSETDFIAAAWEVAGRKVSKERCLSDVYRTAMNSVALPITPDPEAIAMFRMVLAEGRSLLRQRNAIEKRAEAMLGAHPDYRRLKTIPGIGPVNALTVLAEAGDLRRFGHHRQFLKFCGLDRATHQSGQFRGQTKIAKFGNARLRRSLWLAGQGAISQR
ncbi:MAG: IS110 family transposase, partial [Pseudomonadota bacterium]